VLVDFVLAFFAPVRLVWKEHSTSVLTSALGAAVIPTTAYAGELCSTLLLIEWLPVSVVVKAVLAFTFLASVRACVHSEHSVFVLAHFLGTAVVPAMAYVVELHST
jgi:hypothetical protein